MIGATSENPLLRKATHRLPGRTQHDRLHRGARRLCLCFKASEVLREVLKILCLRLAETVKREGRLSAQLPMILLFSLLTAFVSHVNFGFFILNMEHSLMRKFKRETLFIARALY